MLLKRSSTSDDDVSINMNINTIVLEESSINTFWGTTTFNNIALQINNNNNKSRDLPYQTHHRLSTQKLILQI